MGISEVRSPVSSGSPGKVGSGPGIGPGARSNPSRGRADQDPAPQPSLGSGELHVTGPKELPEKHPQERQSPEE